MQEDKKSAVFHTLDCSPTCEKYQDRFTTQISQKNEIFEGTSIKPILKISRAENERFNSTAHKIPYI